MKVSRLSEDSPIPLARSACAVIDGIPVFDHEVAAAHAEPELGAAQVEISVLVLALNEAGSVGDVLQGSAAELRRLGVSFELVVVDGGSTDETAQRSRAAGARVVTQSASGYANALREGFKECSGRFVLTLDADCSHPSELIPALIGASQTSDLVVGSRWMEGGAFAGSKVRLLLSRALNLVFKTVLSLPTVDSSSGYRLYRREALTPQAYRGKDFSILQEILIRCVSEGRRVTEVPLRYRERKEGRSHAALARFALSYLKTLLSMWRLRNDAASADYDHRAYSSRIPLQRFWQRSRYQNIMELLGEFRERGSVLDVGCGSSRIIQDLPHATACDRALPKLRFLRATNRARVCASALDLPFSDKSFDCVVHSQLIEHLPMRPEVFSEIRRVLKPGGVAIIGTVDFGRPWWPMIERIYGLLMPQAYADEHISHYTLESLSALLRNLGFEILERREILASEITIKARLL